MVLRIVTTLAILLVAQSAVATKTATTADGRKVILHENGTWEFVADASDEQGRTAASLALEKKFDIAGGCRLGLRLHNDLTAQIRTLVLRFTAYKAQQVAFETVSRGFSYIKPTTSQYQEISFRGITCDDIVSVAVTAARNCHVGELTKYSASREHCSKLFEVEPSALLPIAKS